MSNTYEIRNVSDLLKVPVNRRHDLLCELETGLMLAEVMSEEIKVKLPRWLHWLCKPSLRVFTWIDDGRHDETVRIGKRIVHERRAP